MNSNKSTYESRVFFHCKPLDNDTDNKFLKNQYIGSKDLASSLLLMKNNYKNAVEVFFYGKIDLLQILYRFGAEVGYFLFKWSQA